EQTIIILRDQGSSLEVIDEKEGPEAADEEDGGDVEPVGNGKRRRLVMPLRVVGGDDPEEVEEAHDDDRQSDDGQDMRRALGAAIEQKNEGHKEVEDDEDQRDRAPAVLRAINIKRRFLGQVSRPDDQVLAELHVSPEHGESEK